jgi:hypothetical protein
VSQPTSLSEAEREEGLVLRPLFDASGLVTCVATDAANGDVLSQASLALPLLVLYEGSIVAVSIVEKTAAKSAANSAPPPPDGTPPPAENPAE